jgi:DNA-binding HxlR family transcriptional regulator
MTNAHRSGCPINLSLEVFGDKWSLLILRDMIFGGPRHFRVLLNGSQEGIASNILANRLKRLVELGSHCCHGANLSPLRRLVVERPLCSIYFHRAN